MLTATLGRRCRYWMVLVPSRDLSAGHLSRPPVLRGDTPGLQTLCAGSQQLLTPQRNCDPPWCPGPSHTPVPILQTHLAFLPSLLASWPPGRRVGSELECLRFLGRPGPRRAGLRELSSLLRVTGGMLETSKHSIPRPTGGHCPAEECWDNSTRQASWVAGWRGSTRSLLPESV